MKLPRRQFLYLTAGAAALPAMSRIARAQTYPSRPVRVIVPFPPGGGRHRDAHLVGQWLSGAPLVIDLLSGQVQVAFDVWTTSLPHIRSGALRALAVADKTRFDQLPDVPTIDDAVPGYEASVWAGVGVPRGTPGEIIEWLNHEINAGLVNPTIKARLAEVATTPKIFTPAEFGAYVAAEIEKWGKVIKFAGIRAE